jgi:hypothetical protein
VLLSPSNGDKRPDEDCQPVVTGTVKLPADRVHTAELFQALGIPTADQSKDRSQRLRVIMESVLGWQAPMRMSRRSSAP